VPDAALDERSHASTMRCADAKRGAGYAVYDPVGQKIGSAEEVFVNREGDPIYGQLEHRPRRNLGEGLLRAHLDARRVRVSQNGKESSEWRRYRC
jgi:hypothetical protein